MEEVELKNVLIVNGEAMIVEKTESMAGLQSVELTPFETPSTILSLNGLISLNGEEGLNLVPQLENGHISYAIQLDSSSFELAPLPVISEVETPQLPPKPKVHTLPNNQNKENQTRLKKKRRKIAPQILPTPQAPKDLQKPTLVESNLGVEPPPPKVRPKSPLTRLTPSQLKQIAEVIEKSRGSKTNLPSTLYDNETNTRIICRVVHPEDISANFKKKKRRRETSKVVGESEVSDTWKTSASRTRSGRVSRPPKHMLKDYKGEKPMDDLSQKENPATTPITDKPGPESPQLESLSLRQKRNISSKFRCPTCQKVYLGYERMRFHFDKYPEHRDNNLLESITAKPPKAPKLFRGFNVKGRGRAKSRSEAFDGLFEVCEERGFFKALSTWEFLLLKLDSVQGGKGKVAALCDELSVLVETVRGVAPRIFQDSNTEQSKSYTLENDNVSQILGIPKGTYLTNETPLKSLKSLRNKQPPVEKPPIPPEETYMLNNEILCDGGLDSVDQIVSERLETLGQDDVISCLGQLPDPNRSLDLMDGLLFTPPQLANQNNVSDSTEDLMKSLESYANHIQAAEPPAPVIDFGVLSQDLGLNGVR